MRVIRIVGATCLTLFAAMMLASGVSHATDTRTATNVSGVEGDAQITVSWTAPSLPPDPYTASGFSIWGYVVNVVNATTSTQLGTVDCTHNGASSGQQCVITTYTKTGGGPDSLVNGTAYNFSVVTKWFDSNESVIRSSLVSDPSASLTPYTTPGQPTAVAGTPSGTTATVSFTAPTDNGGKAITNYTVKTFDSSGNTEITSGISVCGDSATGTSTSRKICGLSTNTGYTFKVVATNPRGDSTTSDASAVVVTAPGAPSISSADYDQTGATSDVTVVWTANASDGAQAITEYEIMPFIGSSEQDSLKGKWTTGALTKVFNGTTNSPALVVGSQYTFKVRAKNATGWSAYSTASSQVLVAKKPDAPSAPTATDLGSGTSASVSWTLLTDVTKNGSDVTKYTAVAYNASSAQAGTCDSATPTSTSCTITGLTNATYTFKVKAVNGRGTSAESSASSSLAIQAVVSRAVTQTIAKTGTVNDGVAGTVSGQVDAGDTISYSYLVTNTGNVALTNVTVTDPAFTSSGDSIDCGGSGSNKNKAASLASSGTVTCTATYTITQSDVDTGSVATTATVASTAGDSGSNPTNATGSVTKTLTRTTSLTIVKGATVNANVAGTVTDRVDKDDTISLTFQVTNTGNVTLTNVDVTDPAFATSGTSIECPGGSGSNKNRIASLLPGASNKVTCTATYTITQANVDAGTVATTATATVGSAPSGVTKPSAVTDNSVSSSITRVASLTIAKGATVNSGVVVTVSNQVDAGDTISLTFQVTNTGNVTLTNVDVTDPSFPTAGTSITCPGGTGSNKNRIASLLPGASNKVTCTATYTITQANINSGTVATTATAAVGSVPTGVTKPSNVSDNTVSSTINRTASLTIIKGATVNSGVVVTVSNQVDAGDTISLTYQVTNGGNVSLFDVDVTDPVFDASGTSIDCGGSGSNKNRKATLLPGAANKVTCTATYTLTQANINSGTVATTATAAVGSVPAGVSAPSNATDNTVSSTINRTASLTIIKGATVNSGVVVTVSNQVDAGDTISLTYQVTNGGNVSLFDVDVTDPVFDASGTSIDCGGSGSNKNRKATLLPGAANKVTCTATYTLTQANINSGTVATTATAAVGSVPAGVSAPSNATDNTVSSTISQVGAVGLVKTHTLQLGEASAWDAGDTVTYSYQVTNTGNVTLTNVDVTDPAFTSSGDSIDCGGSGSNKNRIASLLPGTANKVTCTAVYNVTQDDLDAGTISTVGTATGTGPGAMGTKSGTGSDVIAITPAPAVTITVAGVVNMTAAAPTYRVDAGDKITYTYTVTNTGNVTVSSLTVVDNKVATDATSIDCGGEGSNKNFIPTLLPGVANKVTCTFVYTIVAADINLGSVGAHTATVTGTPEQGTWSTASGTGTANTFPYLLTSAAGTRVAITKPALTIAQDAAVAKTGLKISVALKTPTSTTSTGKVTKYVITFKPTSGTSIVKTLTVTPNKTFSVQVTGVKGKTYKITVVATFANKKTATWSGPSVKVS